MTEPLALVAIVASTFLLAGFVKGGIGLGLPTVSMGLLALALAPAEAAALLVVPSLATNVWQAAGPRLAVLLRRLWPMMLAIAVGTWAGVGLLATDATGHATIALGSALALYALLGLASIEARLPAGAEPFLSPLAGAATGFVSAATGVFVVPAVPYLQALGLGKEDLVQALGISFTVSTVALGAGLAHDGVFTARLAGESLLAVLPALAGMAIGQFVRSRVSPAAFRRWFLLGLLALGAHLALRPLI
jgi:uncharacterized membrane protein YfcA